MNLINFKIAARACNLIQTQILNFSSFCTLKADYLLILTGIFDCTVDAAGAPQSDSLPTKDLYSH